MKINELTAYPKNPRKINASQKRILNKTLDEFGDLSGVVLNVRNGQLVGGHQRSQVFSPSDEVILVEESAQPDSQGTVAVGYVIHNSSKYAYRAVDWDDEKHQAANIAANKGGGEWDWTKLKENLAELDTGAFDMELSAFDMTELENLLASDPLNAPSTDESRNANTQEQAQTYGESGLAKMEVWLSHDQYDDIIKKCVDLLEVRGLASNSDLFVALIEEAHAQLGTST